MISTLFVPILASFVAMSAAHAEDGPDLQKAQRQYERAKYEKALKNLGRDCTASSDVAGCEKLRGFILIALGREGKAEAAFQRLLIADANAELGQDVSPKLQIMFRNARDALSILETLELAPPVRGGGEEPMLLEAGQPRGVDIQGMTVWIQRPGDTGYQPVSMQLQGGVWSGEMNIRVEEGAERLAHYYFLVTLPTGVDIPIGTESSPLMLDLPPTVTGDGESGDNGEDFLSTGTKKEDEDDGEGLPKWAWWTIGGVVTVGAVVAIILLTGGSSAATGDLDVEIEFVN